jgi:hypothetical protein
VREGVVRKHSFIHICLFAFVAGADAYGAAAENALGLTTTRDQTIQYPGRFFGRQERIMGRFLCHVALGGAWLAFRVLEVDDSIPSLTEADGVWEVRPHPRKSYTVSCKWYSGARRPFKLCSVCAILTDRV